MLIQNSSVRPQPQPGHLKPRLFSIAMGLAMGASAVNYMIKSALQLPDAFSTFSILLPLIIFAAYGSALRDTIHMPRLQIIDLIAALFVFLRMVQYAIPADSGMGLQDAAISFVNLGGYYALGRATASSVTFSQFALAFGLVAVATCLASAGLLTESGYDRMSLGEATPVGISQSYLIAAIFLLVMLLTAKHNWARWSCVALLAIVVYLAAQNGTRSVFVALIITSAILSYGLVRKFAPIVRLMAVFSPAALLLAANVFFADFVINSNNRFSVLFGNILSGLGIIRSVDITDLSIEARHEVWSAAFQRVSESPIFGGGAGTIQNILQLSPHNLFLEAGADGGVPAMLLLALFFVIICMLVLRSMQRLTLSTGLCAAITSALLFEYCVSFFLDSARNLMFFSGALVTLVAVSGARLRVGHAEKPS